MTTTSREKGITVREVDWIEGDSPRTSVVNPWAGMTIEDVFVQNRHGRLQHSLVDRVAKELARYAGVDRVN